MKNKKYLVGLVFLLAFSGCSKKKFSEFAQWLKVKVGAIQEQAEEIADDISDTIEDAGDFIEDVADDVADVVDDAGDAISDFAEDLMDELDDFVKSKANEKKVKKKAEVKKKAS